MKINRKGQISTEYLIVISFVTFVVITLLGIALFYSASIKDQIKENQLLNFANKVISSAESVFFAGEPSKVTITAYLPEGVSQIAILENSIVVNITLHNGLSRIAFPSSVPLDPGIQFSTSSGVKRIQITALSDRVLITEG